jgi:hypothetical protein
MPQHAANEERASAPVIAAKEDCHPNTLLPSVRLLPLL